MSHPKYRSGREQNLSTKIPSVGRALFALPTEGSLLSSSLKVLRILKGLFQKSLKQVRTASATFGCGQSPRPCGAGRVVVLDGSRQYHSVCKCDFPIQGDVAPKARIGSKNFHSGTTEGIPCSRPLWKAIYTPVRKFLEFLKPFFQKGFKWVWAKPTTLYRSARQNLTTFPRRRCSTFS